MTDTAHDSLKRPPGPRGRRLLNMRGRFFDLKGFMWGLHRQYGEVVSFNLLNWKCCAVFDAGLIDEVLVVQQDTFRPFFPKARYGIIASPGTSGSHGEDQRQLYKLLSSGFEGDRLIPYAEASIERLESGQDRWLSKGTIEARSEVEHVVMGILLDIAVGRDLQGDPELVKEGYKALKWDIGLRLLPFSSFLRKLPLPQNRQCSQAIADADAIVETAMLKAKDPAHPGDDLVAYLWRGNQKPESGHPYKSDQDIRDEVFQIVFGSIEGPTAALIQGIQHLAQHPEVRTRLEAEVDEVLGGRRVQADDFHRLPYTHAVLKEVLRMEPPTFAMGAPRQALEDCTLNGYAIAKGTLMFPCMGVIQRRSDHWDNGDNFDPDRWLEDPRPHEPKQGYMPFGAGPHRCPGRDFATMMAVYGLASIAQRLRIEPASSKPIRTEYLGVGVRGPIPMVVKERPPQG